VVTRSVPPNGLVYGVPAKLRGFVCECGKKLPASDEFLDPIVLECKCGKKTEVPLETYHLLGAKSHQ